MTARPRRPTALLVAVGLLVAACTSVAAPPSPTQAPTVPPQSSPSPVPTGTGSSAEAMARLCIAPKPSDGKQKQAGDTPSDIAEIEDQVQTVRELRFTHPVAVNPIDDATMDRKLSKAFDQTYPVKFYARRTDAWRTIGVIPQEADIREALLAFQTGQVVGFYNPADGELVYLSGGDLLGSLTERVILAHELTHAIDDQHFDLTRIDDVVATCDDEAFQSALGAVEGSAQHFAFAVAARFPGGTIDSGDGGLPAGVPPFITQLQFWPYTAGQTFIDALDRRGGVKAVNGAIETFPLSTEQVMHPERYPNDVPQPVDVPDLSAALGDGWHDLDVMTVGEAWLQTMLRLRLDHGTADDAAAGWDGGTYRAWTDGDAVAVAMATVWDSDADARAFTDAARSFIDEGGRPGFVEQGENGSVTLGFATDEATLSQLRSALGA
ncbi:MAG: hypothetical protein ACXWYJ_12145 [Actinomycetota bacterium]